MGKANPTRTEKIRQREIVKNEASGVRAVSMIVQEYWECGWESRNARNDKGIDGVIILRRRGADIGGNINIQAKCGDGYVSSEDDHVIRLSLGSSDYLDRHKEHWFSQVEPVVLVFTRVIERLKGADGKIIKDANGKEKTKDIRNKPKSWWVDLKDNNTYPEKSRTIIEIKKENTFGAHSKRDFLQLTSKYKSEWVAKPIIPNKESIHLITTHKLDVESKKFYRLWSTQAPIIFKPIGEPVLVSRVGWRHISRIGRGRIRQNFSKKYLGIAKQIIEQSLAYKVLEVKSSFSSTGEKVKETRFIGIMGTVDSGYDKKMIVQVILIQQLLKINAKIQSKLWFYSVHERKKV